MSAARISTREVKKPIQASWQFTVFSDESVELNDLSLNLLTSLLEKKPSLSPLFTESSSQEAKKAGDQQMSPELLNKWHNLCSVLLSSEGRLVIDNRSLY